MDSLKSSCLKPEDTMGPLEIELLYLDENLLICSMKEIGQEQNKHLAGDHSDRSSATAFGPVLILCSQEASIEMQQTTNSIRSVQDCGLGAIASSTPSTQ